MLVLVLVLENSEPYETFERECGPDHVIGDSILPQTDTARAEFEGLEHEHEHDYEKPCSKTETPGRAS